jgi:hypothetical protein
MEHTMTYQEDINLSNKLLDQIAERGFDLMPINPTVCF